VELFGKPYNEDGQYPSSKLQLAGVGDVASGNVNRWSSGNTV